MSDRLEKFIQDNREEFDLQVPEPRLWNGIEKNIRKTKKIRFTYYLSRAAVVVLIAGITFLVQNIVMNNDLFKPKEKNITSEEVIIPELMEAEMYYSGMVDEKLEELKPGLKKYPTIEKELERDLSELDSVYQGLKDDLKDDVANQEVIEAMIQNYRLRVSILEDMLEFLNEQNNIENSNLSEHDI